MAGQTITLSIPDVLTMEGQPAPVVSEVDGNLVVTLNYDGPEAAVKGAKAAVRELVKFRLDKNVKGERHSSQIVLTFGQDDDQIPATWRGRAGSATVTGTKPAILTEIQTALKPYAKAMYFNSSVNEGLTVDSVPVGLQFETRGEDCYAKLLLSKKGEWKEVPIDSADQAVTLVDRLQNLLVDL